MTNKAFSLLAVKSANDGPDGMTVEGIASTPQPDRVKDIVEPMGAKFAVPMPLFMNHDSRQVVGRVEFAKVTPTGIPFRAFLPHVKETGRLKERIDEAMHQLRYRLIGAVSIGFKALEGGAELMKSGGIRFRSWEWLELSLVQIPANPGAVITGIKSIDSEFWRAISVEGAPIGADVVRIAPLARSSAAYSVPIPNKETQ